MKVLWIATCTDCKWCNTVGLVKMCGHPGFKGKGRSREIKDGTIPKKLCPLPDYASCSRVDVGPSRWDKEPKTFTRNR